MKKLIICLLFVNSAYATCFMERLRCVPSAKFQNIYELQMVSCSPPGGPVSRTETLNIYNELVSSCGANPRPGCLKPIASRVLNFSRNMFFQAEIRIDRSGNYLRIDDRRFLQPGEFHISTPNAGFIRLDGYQCKVTYN